MSRQSFPVRKDCQGFVRFSSVGYFTDTKARLQYSLSLSLLTFLQRGGKRREEGAYNAPTAEHHELSQLGQECEVAGIRFDEFHADL